MTRLHDHEIKYLDTAEAYLALKRQAERDDRSVGSLLRHIVHAYLHDIACAERLADASERPEPGHH